MDAQTERAIVNELHKYLDDAEERERDADRRNTALIRAHEAGWRLVAQAIERGLGEIADAISKHR